MNDNEYDKLLNLVVDLTSQLNLPNCYKAPVDCPFLPKEARERIVQKETVYEKNLQLKWKFLNF